jgi:hypothetical protein
VHVIQPGILQQLTGAAVATMHQQVAALGTSQAVRPAPDRRGAAHKISSLHENTRHAAKMPDVKRHTLCGASNVLF